MKNKIVTLLGGALSLFFLGCDGRSYVIKNGKVYHRTTHEGDYGKLTELPDADAETFEKLEHPDYAKDKNYVYRQKLKIEGADPASFEILDKDFTKDKNTAYYRGKSIANAQGANFKILRGWFSTDGTNVFYQEKPLNVCSVDNFRFLKEAIENNWSTDGCHYFWYAIKIPSEDYENTVVFTESSGYAKDREHVYNLSKIYDTDNKGNTFTPPIDVPSFEFVDEFMFKDKHGCIDKFKGRVVCE